MTDTFTIKNIYQVLLTFTTTKIDIKVVLKNAPQPN